MKTKTKAKELYQTIKVYYKIADELNEYSFTQESDYWDNIGQATENITEAIDLMEEAING